MEDEGDLKEPENSAVFETKDGKKVRVEFDKVFSYLGKTKAGSTTIEYGYGYEKDSRETFVLDIDFDSFDAKLTQYKDDVKKYWKNKYASDPY
jgi:hypothetical protein